MTSGVRRGACLVEPRYYGVLAVKVYALAGRKLAALAAFEF